MKTTKIILTIALLAIVAFSCKKDDETSQNKQPAVLTVRLTDAPAAYDAVNIDIVSIGVRIDSGWYDFQLDNPGIYDLISLSNGTTALLVSGIEVPAGNITQMRLVLGDSNTIVVEGRSFELKTPSGQTSGYKVKMNATVEPGVAYQVLIDFDASKSIVEQGNGQYLLKPVVYGNLTTAIGQIDGYIAPSASGTVASAWNSTDTLSVFIDQTTGFFLINSLVPGPYTVRITATAPYIDTTILNVPAVAGQVTHMDTIVMHQ